MVGMTVDASGIKGGNHLGTHPPQMPHEYVDDRDGVGLVQIPIDDFGTDGFDQDLYVLHYPDEKAVVALLVKF